MCFLLLLLGSYKSIHKVLLQRNLYGRLFLLAQDDVFLKDIREEFFNFTYLHVQLHFIMVTANICNIEIVRFDLLLI